MRRTVRVVCVLAWVFRVWLAGLLAGEQKRGGRVATFRGILECPGNPHDTDATIILRTLDCPLVLNLTPSMQSSLAKTVNSRKMVEITGERDGTRLDVAGWALF